jgi:predicted O-methyltransferase YrrM
MISLRKIGKPIISSVWRRKAQKKISGLSKNSEGYTKEIGNALTEVLQNIVSEEEKQWIDKIESLRKELESSNEKIEVIDYGAIEPDSNITNQELEIGKTVNITVGAKCKSGSELFFWVFILFKLIRKFQPKSCLELGSCMGLSASFQAAALKLNGIGKMVTLEGAASLALIAKKNFQLLNLGNIDIIEGRFQDTLPTVLKRYGPFDYVFIDGHLDGTATINNFNQIIPYVSDKALFIVDNISWSESMKKGWKYIESNERVRITFHLRQMGICIIDNKIVKKQVYKIPLL